MADSEPSITRDPTPEERAGVAARQALPATYIDTWTTSTWPGHIRISLGEEFADTEVYRFACVMTLNDAVLFAEHLLSSVQNRREKERAAEAASAHPIGEGA